MRSRELARGGPPFDGSRGTYGLRLLAAASKTRAPAVQRLWPSAHTPQPRPEDWVDSSHLVQDFLRVAGAELRDALSPVRAGHVEPCMTLFKLFLLLCVALVLEALGVVILSQGLRQIGEIQQFTVSEIVRVIVRGATNRKILLGIFMEAIFFGMLLVMLKNWDVSLI